MKKILIVILMLVAFLLQSQMVGAFNFPLSWTAPIDYTDGTALTPAGYKVYCGTVSGKYTSVIDVGNTLSYTETGMLNNTTYYCVATCYDSSKAESAYSNEVVKVVKVLPSAPSRCIAQ